MSKRSGLLHPVCLGGILAVGVGTVWAAVVGWGVTIEEQLSRDEQVYERVFIQLDGTPVIESYTASEYEDRAYRTLDGHPVELDGPPRVLGSASLRGPVREHGRFLRLGWNERIRALYDDQRPPNFWYFIHDGKKEGTGYFVGYNSKAKLLVGYIGLKGFRPDKPPLDELFRVDGRIWASGAFAKRYYRRNRPWVDELYAVSGRISGWIAHLITEDGLLEIDLSKQTVHVVMESAELQSVNTLSRPLPSTAGEDPLAEPRYEQLLVVSTSDRVVVLDRDGHQQDSYLLPAELRTASHMTFCPLNDGSAVLYRYPYFAGIGRHRLYWIDREGKITRREEVLLQQGRYLDQRTRAYLLSLAIPAPIASTITASVATPMHYLESGQEPDYGSALRRSLSDWWPAMLVICVVAVGLASVCYRHQKQFAMPTSYAWIVFVFLAGAPGLLGFYLHRRWPSREECPACGKNTPRDRESCSACRVEFPRPEPKGTEVFAS